MEQMSRTDNLIFCYGLVVEFWAVSSDSWSARVRKCKSFDWLGRSGGSKTRDGAIAGAVETAVKYLTNDSHRPTSQTLELSR